MKLTHLGIRRDDYNHCDCFCSKCEDCESKYTWIEVAMTGLVVGITFGSCAVVYIYLMMGIFGAQ